MTIVAVILNIVAFVVIVLLWVDEAGSVGYPEALIFLLFGTVPIVNLIVLARRPGWLQLYLKRRALEEKKKIEALTSNTETKQDIESK